MPGAGGADPPDHRISRRLKVPLPRHRSGASARPHLRPGRITLGRTRCLGGEWFGFAPGCAGIGSPPSGRSPSARPSTGVRSRSRRSSQSDIRCASMAAARILQQIVLQRVGPRVDVRRAVPRLVRDAELLAGHHRGDLRPQLLAGAGVGAESVRLSREPVPQNAAQRSPATSRS